VKGDIWQDRYEEAKKKRLAAQRIKAAKAGRDEGGFVPWLKLVQQSPGWRRASHVARSLLMDVIHSGLNGKLTASKKYLEPLGWSSDAVIRRATKELLACGLLHMTRQGQRPNTAACYAATWIKLEVTEGLDLTLVRQFKRGAYLTPESAPQQPQKQRTAAATAARQMQAICRRDGYTLAPSHGATTPAQRTVARCIEQSGAPSDGAVRPGRTDPTAPSDGPYLEHAICHQQRQAAQTRFGRLLALRAKPGLQPGYAEARRHHPMN
jgi:hypothetical protein